jgi:putative colanic acid biosynthesis acetyltransferase WcaF
MRPDILDAKASKPIEGGPSFSLGNRLYRAAWRLAWLALASWTPPALRGWRALVLRAFGATIAPSAVVYASARIWDPRNLEMGPHACLGPRCDCYAMATIVLEAYAVVSHDATLCAGTHDIDDPTMQLVVKPIRLGARAWIAAGAFVGPGVSVGEGAVLGARGVAFRDLEAWAVYVGNPATHVRARARSGGEHVVPPG